MADGLALTPAYPQIIVVLCIFSKITRLFALGRAVVGFEMLSTSAVFAFGNIVLSGVKRGSRRYGHDVEGDYSECELHVGRSEEIFGYNCDGSN
jgi:hypothetical protein